MKTKRTFNSLFQNDKFAFLCSFLAALCIWLVVSITASPQTTRVIKDVKVTIDDAVPSQFDLRVFGNDEFTVDVTVKGKKYQISEASLSADDISVVAQTTSVDSAGVYTLQLKAEGDSDNTPYTISSLSTKTIEVYFDTEKTSNFVIEPEIITSEFDIADEGYTCGDINLSETSVTITGPSTQINRIEKVVAQLVLDGPLTSNKSAETKILPYDDANKSDFEYLSMSIEDVVVTIPILKIKSLDTAVTFKNAPDSLVLNPLKYSITPNSAEFNIVVDDFDKISEYVVGSINFKELSPTSNTFTFDAKNTSLVSEDINEFTVSVNLDDYTQEYMKVTKAKIKVNNPKKLQYEISDLNKSIVVVGTEEDLKGITEDMILIDVDLSSVTLEEGKRKTIPAVVNVNSPTCWVYGAYTVDVSLKAQ